MQSASREIGTHTSVVHACRRGAAPAPRRTCCAARATAARDPRASSPTENPAPPCSAAISCADRRVLGHRCLAGAVELEEQRRLHRIRQARVAVHRVDLHLVEQLDARHRDAELDRRDDRPHGAFHRLERADRRRDRFGQAVQAQRDLGDDAQRAFRADEQARQVVARRRLARAAAGLDHAAVGEHHRQAEHGFAHRPVANGRRAGGARGGHAADRGVGAGIDPEVRRPVFASALFNWRWVTPASTVASRSSALTRSTRFMRERSIDTPPLTALTWPSSEEPDAERHDRRAVPRGDAATIGAHFVGGERKDNDVRQPGGCHDSP